MRNFRNYEAQTQICNSIIKELCERHSSKQKDSRGPSFATISASGPNAALAHYR